jgi:hypothetical protein
MFRLDDDNKWTVIISSFPLLFFCPFLSFIVPPFPWFLSLFLAYLLVVSVHFKLMTSNPSEHRKCTKPKATLSIVLYALVFSPFLPAKLSFYYEGSLALERTNGSCVVWRETEKITTKLKRKNRIMTFHTWNDEYYVSWFLSQQYQSHVFICACVIRTWLWMLKRFNDSFWQFHWDKRM